MTVQPPPFATLRLVLGSAKPLVLTFSDGQRVRLRNFVSVDPSVYGTRNQWTATVDEVLEDPRTDRPQFFRPGSGMDFLGGDVQSVLDEGTGMQLYPVASESGAED